MVTWNLGKLMWCGSSVASDVASRQVGPSKKIWNRGMEMTQKADASVAIEKRFRSIVLQLLGDLRLTPQSLVLL